MKDRIIFMPPEILIITHDEKSGRTLAAKLGERAIMARLADIGQALQSLADDDCGVVLLDVREQSRDAVDTLHSIKRSHPGAEVILLSDAESIHWSMEGMRRGALDDIGVPFDVDLLLEKIKAAHAKRTADIKRKGKRGLAALFSETMVAATFAQAGEFETAKALLRRSNPVKKKK